jgi:ribosome assembly protein YihI (activator of Der GTPase)
MEEACASREHSLQEKKEKKKEAKRGHCCGAHVHGTSMDHVHERRAEQDGKI